MEDMKVDFMVLYQLKCLHTVFYNLHNRLACGQSGVSRVHSDDTYWVLLKFGGHL